MIKKKLKQLTHQALRGSRIKSTWLIKYTDEKYAPHEMLHVVDSISTYQQKSLKKSFRPILTKYTETYKQYPLAKDIAYHTQANEVFARLMNQWLYANQIVETEPLLESERLMKLTT